MTVNRPFSAFTALLVLLALAMFAVSSTSRSTTVQAVRQQSGANFGSRPLGETNFVFIVPASQEGAAEKERTAACGMQTAADFFVTSRDAQRQANNSIGELATGEKCIARRQLAAARILVADLVSGEAASTPEFACRSDPEPASERAGGRSGGAGSALSEAQIVAIFQEFGLVQRGASLPRGGAARRWARVAWTQCANHAAAVQTWLKYQWSGWTSSAGRATPSALSVVSQQLSWDDYVELIDGAGVTAAATTDAASSSGVWQSVRFGDWLRHSAAASWLYLRGPLPATAAEAGRQ